MAVWPPLTNATMTVIAGGGFAEDYDTAAGADTSRWSGSARAYVEEKLESQVQGNTISQVAMTRLAVPLEPGGLAQRGDTVTYTYGGDTFSREVQNVQRYYKAGGASLWFFDG